MKRVSEERHRARLRNRIAVTVAVTATALSLAVLADDDRRLRDDPLPEDSYSDPWATQYENPFADSGEQNHRAAPVRLRLYDDFGRRTGRVGKEPTSEGSDDLYDRRGRRTGRFDESPLLDES
jgi:hypothetical protein